MGFRYVLERVDGTPADPPTVKLAVPNMRPGDTIPLPRGRTLRVVQVRFYPDQDPALVVEDVAQRASSARR